jgi:hypothetical protein
MSPDYSNKSANKNLITSRSSSGSGRALSKNKTILHGCIFFHEEKFNENSIFNPINYTGLFRLFWSRGGPPLSAVPTTPDNHKHCGDGGDGGNPNGMGSDISMNCLLGASSGDDPWPDGSVDTITDDGFADYVDAEDKVDCSIRGPSIPWPIRLGVGGGKGKWANVRQVDINLGPFDENTGEGPFDMGTYVHPYGWTGDKGAKELFDIYPNLFTSGTGDPLRLNVRPYRERETQTDASIHLLTPGESYEMGMRFTVPASTGIERFAVSIASQWYGGNEGFTGIACESGDELAILANSPEKHSTETEDDDGPMRDVSVYLWPDVDEDGYAKAYTVTTGSINFDEETGDFVGITPGTRWAAVCSAAGPQDCGNPKAPNNCNFLGYVEVQFTLYTVVQ